MEFLPFYSYLKIGGHFACAFVATMLSGGFLTLLCLLKRQFQQIERSFVFALFASTAIWIVPMFCDVSSQIREVLVYVFSVLSVVLLKVAFGRSLKSTALMSIVFVMGQVIVFFLVYKKVF